jgi:hypothetical protein
MNFVKLEISPYGTYSYADASNIAMNILGSFFTTIGCHKSMYKDWALADKSDPQGKFGYSCGANIIFLEEEVNDIYLSDNYSEEDVPTRLKMSKKQFVMLLDEWQEKVCKHKPREVIIKYDDDQFFIETIS